jgi:hypothetical protein
MRNAAGNYLTVEQRYSALEHFDEDCDVDDLCREDEAVKILHDVSFNNKVLSREPRALQICEF